MLVEKPFIQPVDAGALLREAANATRCCEKLLRRAPFPSRSGDHWDAPSGPLEAWKSEYMNCTGEPPFAPLSGINQLLSFLQNSESTKLRFCPPCWKDNVGAPSLPSAAALKRRSCDQLWLNTERTSEAMRTFFHL